jgi:hypothetical protein
MLDGGRDTKASSFSRHLNFHSRQKYGRRGKALRRSNTGATGLSEPHLRQLTRTVARRIGVTVFFLTALAGFRRKFPDNPRHQ